MPKPDHRIRRNIANRFWNWSALGEVQKSWRRNLSLLSSASQLDQQDELDVASARRSVA